MSKKNSARKAYLASRYVPLVTYKSRKTAPGEAHTTKKELSSTISKQEKRKSSENSDIPSLLKKNIAALTESSESIKLTNFGKSCVLSDEDIFSPPKKQKCREFENLLVEDSALAEYELFSRKFENQRLKCLKMETTTKVGMLSSPSMMESNLKTSSPKAKFLKDLKNSKETETSIEKSNKSSVQDIKEVKCDKVDTIRKENNKTIEEAPKETKIEEKKNLDKIDSPKKSECRSLPFKTLNDNISKIGQNYRKQHKSQLENLRSLVSNIKALNESILHFRKEMAETLKD